VRRVILDAVATAVLSPLLLVQALMLRRRALRLPEAAGPRQGVTGEGPPLGILIVGDSSAAGVGADDQGTALAGQLAAALGPHHRVTWHLIAATGATTPGTLARLQTEAVPRADVVVVILGVNDVTRGGPMGGWLRSHAALRAHLRVTTGARRIYVSQVPPLGAFPLLPHPLRWLLGRRATRFDAALQAAVRDAPGVAHVPLPDGMDPGDMATDGFHPGPVIYALWAQEMARRILSDRQV